MEFNTLLKNIEPKLRNISYRLKRNFGHFDEDDMFQEAVMSLWEKYERGDLEGKTESFILQGCAFHLKNYIRMMLKKLDRETVNMDTMSIDADGAETEIAHDIGAKDPEFAFLMVDIAIDEIMSVLDEKEKDVLTLGLEEMTTREIGERLGISHTMVVKIDARIRSKTRELFSDKLKNNSFPNRA